MVAGNVGPGGDDLGIDALSVHLPDPVVDVAEVVEERSYGGAVEEPEPFTVVLVVLDAHAVVVAVATSLSDDRWRYVMRVDVEDPGSLADRRRSRSDVGPAAPRRCHGIVTSAGSSFLAVRASS
jgi:hypothetical protein